MDLNPSNKLLEDFKPGRLIEYLNLKGWRSLYPNKKWTVLEGPPDYYGHPLELALPQDLNSPDIFLYVSNAVNMLSSLDNMEPELLLHNIKFYDRDILRIKNLETNSASSISLSLAAQQVPQLKSLVSFAACSEVDAAPSHASAQKPLAKQMVKQYQFGHTFRGSFGYTVESPLPEAFSSMNIMAGVKYLPVERRVMERIVRGLSFTKIATETRNTSVLTDNYADGFNANMCTSIVKMSPEKLSPIEFYITWSPTILPSEDIGEPEPITLTEASFDQLQYAAETLEKLEPKEVTIRGLVKELRTDDNPLGLDTSRTVVIDITNDNDSLPNRVTVLLSATDYQAAIVAHKEWLPITIKGFLQRRHGNKWHIIKYSSFKVTPKLF
jgi:hypothetical protein